MQQPKKLTLTQAINATEKSIARLGDLIYIQIMPGLKGWSGYTSDEMPGALMPHQSDFSIRNFKQPETAEFIHALYRDGGRIESVAHFDDESLALHYNYTLGVRIGAFSSSAGDARYFEVDCSDAVELLPPNSSRETMQAAIRIVLMLHKKYKLASNLGERHSKSQVQKARGKRPVKNEDGHPLDDVIRKLARAYPREKPSEGWIHLKTALEDWGDTREIRETGEGESRGYRFKRGDTSDGIAFSTFAKKFRKYKTGI